MEAMHKTTLTDLKLLKQGKVRDIYDLGEYLLLVATDRISAFDVIMDQPVPGKGRILSTISKYWFDNTKHIIPNHLVSSDVNDYPEACRQYSDYLEGRSMLVKKCKPLAVEFIVRGYVAGSGWKEYKKSNTVCGIALPQGLLEFSKLPEPVFTPSTKEDTGHDENINYEQYAEILGEATARKLADISIALYNFGADYMNKNVIILADTKFEFGYYNDEIILIDEALTPDSSRFWLKETYKPGTPQMQFDKQILRDYLETLDWDKTPPPPKLPAEVLDNTLSRYNEALNRIKGLQDGKS